MRREFHVRFCEGLGVRFPRATRLVVLSRGHAAQALEWTRATMEDLKLTLSEKKTRLCDARKEAFDFLGYTFGPEYYRRDGHWYLSAKPSRRSITRLKGKVRAHLRSGNMAPWPVIAARLNRLLRGWTGYFGYGTRYMAYRTMDNYVYHSVRRFLKRRHKVKTCATKRFPAEVVFGELGVQRLRAIHLGPPAHAHA